MRKEKIVNYIDENKKATVEELAQKFYVSVETIRRDLKTLDTMNLLIRVHGGAMTKQTNDIGKSFNHRARNNIDKKQELVKQAIKEIKTGDVIGLDASSSSWLFAQALPNDSFTIVTNSLNVILALERKTNISVISVGGNYSEKYKAFYGKVANENLKNMNLDLCVFSCVGFDFNSGFWDSNEYNCEIKQTLVSISEKTMLIADKSKFNKKSLLNICSFDDVDLLITDCVK